MLHPAGAAWLLAAAVIAVIPQALAGHTAQSRDHDIAVDSMIYHLLGMCLWVGGLIAVLGLARQHVAHLDVITRRYSAVALVAFAAVAGSGLLNAAVRLTSPADLWTTGYGRLVLVKAAVPARPGRVRVGAPPPGPAGDHPAGERDGVHPARRRRDRGDGRDHRGGHRAVPHRHPTARRRTARRRRTWC